MSFRMRGAAFDQGCSAARYAATWVLIVSMTSSSLVLAAPNRRETRRAKKNCCPEPTCCEPAKTCDACSHCGSETVVVPANAPTSSESNPTSPAPTPAPAPSPAPALSSAPVAEKAPPDPKPAAEVNTGFRRPKSYSPLASDIGVVSPTRSPTAASPVRPKTEKPKPTLQIESESGISEAAPIVISDEPPPEPSRFEPGKLEPAREAQNRDAPSQRDPFGEPETPPTIEPPKPASGSGKYQEYIERYFNRKSSEPDVPKEDPVAPELNKTPAPSLDEPPALTPSKPAQEYNDPFRPTSYRHSQERTWRDSSGESRMKARFIGVDDKGMARMIREDGKQSRIPLANLSESDQRYIELLAIRDPVASHQNVASRTRGK